MPRTATAASSTSPATVPVGFDSTTLLPPVFAPFPAARNAMPGPPGGVTAIVTAAADESVVPSLTLYVNESGPV